MSRLETEKNRRQRERLNLSLPIRVQWRKTKDDSCEEITRLIDVTPFGAGFALSREIEVGRMLLLTIPMPRQLRCYDHAEQQYRVWALVRHVRKMSPNDSPKGNYSIGVAFTGKHPPIGYLDNPARFYEVIETDAVGFWRVREITSLGAGGENQNGETRKPGIDLRRQTRHPIPLNVAIEVFNERGDTVASEMTVTENISLTGAAVFTTLDVERGRFVRLTSEQYDITIVAIVRTRKIGADGIARLHLEFIDRRFPLDLLG